jgi:TetR/AcrR family transcriptional repressor of nem operon
VTAETREKILMAGAQLIHRQGYHHTGIKDILDSAGIPKGSFYFYFKSKEHFALELVGFFEQFWQGQAAAMLAPGTKPPLTRLREFFAFFFTHFREQGFSSGCPVGNLGQEMGDTSPALAARLAQAIDGMAARVAAVLGEAQALGHLPPGSDPRSLAYFIIAAWQGGLIRMKVSKSPEPLEIFDHVVFERLLGPGTPDSGHAQP